MNASYAISFLGGLGIWEILLILAIVTLLFGASRIPEVAKSLGMGVNEFKKGLKGEDPDQKKISTSQPPAADDKTPR